MGVRVLEGESGGALMACLYCSTSEWAFGPLFRNREEAEGFLHWLPRYEDCDVRRLSDRHLESMVSMYRKEQSRVEADEASEPE